MTGARLLLLGCLWSSSIAAETVRPTLDLPSVLVEIRWVESEAELRSYHERYKGESISFGARLRGFSVLYRRDGEYRCLIVAHRPEEADDSDTLTLGHELAHCLLGDYHTQRTSRMR